MSALFHDPCSRALRPEFEPVICLEAPEAVQVPRSLLRADGRSIYQRHGGVRYATRAQLATEERLVTQASAGTAPRLTRAGAARALGADLARLEDALAGRAQELQDHHPERTGLTADQSAAVLSVLTDGKRVSVLNAPAGSGKTRVMTEAARVWAAGGRPVVGMTPSQSARNTPAAGVPGSYNTAQFLGHLPGQRSARGPLEISGDILLLVDESSMIPTPDLADVVALAEARSAKMVLAGDTGQLQAVENGGSCPCWSGGLPTSVWLTERHGSISFAQPFWTIYVSHKYCLLQSLADRRGDDVG
jgi:AAA domain